MLGQRHIVCPASHLLHSSIEVFGAMAL